MLRDDIHDGNEAPAAGGPSSAKVVLHVDDIGATRARCIANGATDLMPAGDKFRGERTGRIVRKAFPNRLFRCEGPCAHKATAAVVGSRPLMYRPAPEGRIRETR